MKHDPFHGSCKTLVCTECGQRESAHDAIVIKAEADVLSGRACTEEQKAGNGPCGVCKLCLQNKITQSSLYDLDMLRSLVRRTCHTPIMAGGQFVPVDDTQHGVGRRGMLATTQELLAALELQIRHIQKANAYLQTQLTRGEPAKLHKLLDDWSEAQRLFEAAENDIDGQLEKNEIDAQIAVLAKWREMRGQVKENDAEVP